MAKSEYSANVDLLKSAAVALGPLLDRVAFVGGATTILHLTETIRDVRATLDVDVIVDMTRAEFQQAEEELRSLGFQPDSRLICRHRKDDLVVDFMPIDSRILGFSSRWYADALRNAQRRDVAGIQIKVLTFPYFVATKLEAFKGRGQGDYVGSKDIEDLIAVFAGRPTFLRELAVVEGELGRFIRDELGRHIESNEFLSTLEGNMPRDSRTSAGRIVADLRELVAEI